MPASFVVMCTDLNPVEDVETLVELEAQVRELVRKSSTQILARPIRKRSFRYFPSKRPNMHAIRGFCSPALGRISNYSFREVGIPLLSGCRALDPQPKDISIWIRRALGCPLAAHSGFGLVPLRVVPSVRAGGSPERMLKLRSSM